MLTQQEIEKRKKQAVELIVGKAGLALTEAEKENLEIADFGLSDFEKTGLGVLVYVNTDRVCAKELAMLPHQTCPEHRHPTVAGKPGKEETFRCRWGRVFIYLPGEPVEKPAAIIPEGREDTYTVFREVILEPGEQCTLEPDTLHWFQAGPEGAVVSEFSTTSTDEADIFTDEEINRFTQVVDS